MNVINPEDKTNILSSRLLQLNTEYTTAQGERVTKEAAYNSLKSGSLAAIQISPQAEALSKLQELVQASKQRLAEVKTTYGPNYAEYKRAANQLAELERQYDETKSEITQRIEVEYRQAKNREEMLKTAVGATKSDWDKLNASSFEYQQLKREAEADKNTLRRTGKEDKRSRVSTPASKAAVSASPILRALEPNPCSLRESNAITELFALVCLRRGSRSNRGTWWIAPSKTQNKRLECSRST